VICISLNDREGTDREGPKTSYLHGHREEAKFIIGQRSQVCHVLDDRDVVAEQNAVDGATEILNVVNVVRVDSD